MLTMYSKSSNQALEIVNCVQKICVSCIRKMYTEVYNVCEQSQSCI